MQVNQLLAAAHEGDATGDAALALAGALEARGITARLYAISVDEPLRDRVGAIDQLPAGSPTDTTILHFNVPSPLNDVLCSRYGRRVVVYHNLTPPELLVPYCPDIARLTALGRRQLEELARCGCVDLAIGVSEFNRRDLADTGFETTVSLPLPTDLSRLSGPSNPVLEAELAAEPMPTFLTVGRVAPNKRLDDFLKMAAYYLRYIGPQARFVIVGGIRGLEPYFDALAELHAALHLDRRVSFAGHVSLADLVTYYRAADAYVCTSAHEGFCAPLLEAMTFEVPIVARPAAAVPETLGNAGVLVEGDDPGAWAEMLHLVVTDDDLRSRLQTLGAHRVAQFETASVLERWIEALAGDPSP